MQEYAYRAVSNDGHQVRGQVHAINEQDLYRRLQERGLELIDWSDVKPGRSLGLGKQKVTTRDLIQLFVHLGHLDSAGVPLLEGVADVRDSTDNKRLRDVMAEIYRDVGEGMSLSAAFGRHATIFTHVTTGLIEVGEQTGNLGAAFRELVKHFKWTAAMTAMVKKATRYPMFLGIGVLLVMGFMMAVVVPQVTEFLLSMNIELPVQTRALIWTSNAVQNYGYVLVLVPALFYGGVFAVRRLSDQVASVMDYYILRVPVIGPVIRKIELSRYSHMFATMFQSGIEILQCLEMGSRMIGNRHLAESAALVKERVATGDSLAKAMRTAGAFPDIVIRMVKIGEDSGKLTETLETVVEFYDRDVEETIDAMISAIEPALTVIMGGMMGWIALAVFGPIYDSLGELGA